MRFIPTLTLSLLAAPCTLGALLHLFTDDSSFVLATLHGSIGWWLVLATPLAALALALGRRKLALLFGVVALAHASWVLPGNLPRWPAPPVEHPLKVATSNLLAVNPTPERLTRELLSLDPDVLCVEECTPAWMERLDNGEPAQRWPHRAFDPSESGFGMALLSKIPFEGAEGVEFVDLGGVPLGIAHINGITVGCVHTEPPRSPLYTQHWHDQMQGLRDWAAGVEGPLLLLGDFNATRHHPSWQALVEGARLHDAHSEVGRASAGSWPAPPYWDFLPWLRIDHVLLSPQLHALSAREGEAQGSDHRPLVVELLLSL